MIEQYLTLVQIEFEIQKIKKERNKKKTCHVNSGDSRN